MCQVCQGPEQLRDAHRCLPSRCKCHQAAVSNDVTERSPASLAPTGLTGQPGVSQWRGNRVWGRGPCLVLGGLRRAPCTASPASSPAAWGPGPWGARCASVLPGASVSNLGEGNFNPRKGHCLYYRSRAATQEDPAFGALDCGGARRGRRLPVLPAAPGRGTGPGQVPR